MPKTILGNQRGVGRLLFSREGSADDNQRRDNEIAAMASWQRRVAAVNTTTSVWVWNKVRMIYLVGALYRLLRLSVLLINLPLRGCMEPPCPSSLSAWTPTKGPPTTYWRLSAPTRSYLTDSRCQSRSISRGRREPREQPL